MILSVRRKAAELGTIVAVSVYDAAGQLMALSRMDGSKVFLVEMALGKGFTAAVMQRNSEEVGRNPFFATGPRLMGGRITPLIGGFPIWRNGRIEGSIGIAGGTDDENIQCGQTALAAIGATSTA